LSVSIVVAGWAPDVSSTHVSLKLARSDRTSSTVYDPVRVLTLPGCCWMAAGPDSKACIRAWTSSATSWLTVAAIGCRSDEAGVVTADRPDPGRVMRRGGRARHRGHRPRWQGCLRTGRLGPVEDAVGASVGVGVDVRVCDAEASATAVPDGLGVGPGLTEPRIVMATKTATRARTATAATGATPRSRASRGEDSMT